MRALIKEEYEEETRWGQFRKELNSNQKMDNLFQLKLLVKSNYI